MKKDSTCNEIILSHTQKLEKWYKLLKEIMPDYFFKSFSKKELEAILPLLFNVENDDAIQRIERNDTIILIYIKSATNNLRTTSRMMRRHNIASASAYESKQPIVINGVPSTLVIECFRLTTDSYPTQEATFSFTQVKNEYKKKFKKVPEQLKSLYNRIIWSNVSDLNLETLVSRIMWTLTSQDNDYISVGVERTSPKEFRLTLSRQCTTNRGGFYYKIIDAVNNAGITINRAYFREIVTAADDPYDFTQMPVMISTLYISSKDLTLKSKKIETLLSELKLLNWTCTNDLFHEELVNKENFLISEANILRASAEFIHAQLSFIDRNEYQFSEIQRFVALYPAIARDIVKYFKDKFNPVRPKSFNENAIIKRITKRIDNINTGVHDKDVTIKCILKSILNFIQNILKTNFYTENKACLSFRLSPDFMDYYATISPDYLASFPNDKPHGVFFFYRDNAIGFQIRFSEIARGGWRTVIPRHSTNRLERYDNYEFAKDEIFKEVFVLAHTQHLKNKDIYEGGSKMITLLDAQDSPQLESLLFEVQRATCAAILSLINYDSKGKLRDKNIVDYLKTREIIEIGPDERMFDPMITWIGQYATKQKYILKDGLISGKKEKGINHKEFGVTSFGVHQNLLHMLEFLEINPKKDDFSVKISGGPFGDVAGNELKLLLQKRGANYLYPNLKIVAITDGPAAAYDPNGLNKEELSRITLKENLDAFDPELLTGDGAYMIFTQPILENGSEQYKLLIRKNNTLEKHFIGRDEFMKFFQHNIYQYADIFIPCGGRPSTIDAINWEDYCPHGHNSSLAIVEGANSFITPEARLRLQEKGIYIIKDASANKCGVITSSYEILSGLMLNKKEFNDNKPELVKEIMNKLKEHASREATWLLSHHISTGKPITDLTETLSRAINAKNNEISNYLTEHPEIITDKLILSHLPALFSEKFADRVSNIPEEYRLVIASVELASRIVYRHVDSIKQEIESVL